MSWTNVFHLQSDMFNVSPWAAVLNGTGASVNAPNTVYLSSDNAQKPQGTMELTTGTTATGTAKVGMNVAEGLKPGNGCALGLARLAAEVLSTVSEEYAVRFGFHDQSSTDSDVSDGVYWEYLRTASVNWAMCCAGSSTRSKTASGVVVDTNYIWLAIFLNSDWTSADFITSQDGKVWAVAGSQSGGNMPISSEQVGFSTIIRKSAGTTARLQHLDVLGYRYDALRGTA